MELIESYYCTMGTSDLIPKQLAQRLKREYPDIVPTNEFLMEVQNIPANAI